MKDVITLNIKPKIENDLMVMSLDIENASKTGDFLNDCIINPKNEFYSHYLAIKDQLWSSRRIDCPSILKIVGDDRLSTKNADKISSLTGTVYPNITEKDNQSRLDSILSIISMNLHKKDTSRLVIRNMPNHDTYLKSISDSSIDVPCATQFQYLKDRFIVTFRAHALKSEFVADLCLIYKYYFRPVYQINKTPIKYQIISNTTQEIDYLESTEIKKFLKSL